MPAAAPVSSSATVQRRSRRNGRPPARPRPRSSSNAERMHTGPGSLRVRLSFQLNREPNLLETKIARHSSWHRSTNAEGLLLCSPEQRQLDPAGEPYDRELWRLAAFGD